MIRDFEQFDWNARVEEDLRAIVALAMREDVGEIGDWTTRALVPVSAQGRAAVAARSPGTIAGLRAVPSIVSAVDPQLRWSPTIDDGQPVEPGAVLGEVNGPAASMLVAERLLLNVVGRLSGIATMARQYVDAVRGTAARIYDTRKTTPGWRRLEKYAVRCGGGCNHRMDLSHEALIKDNHLALMGVTHDDPAGVELAVDRVRAAYPDRAVEVEVESMAQLEAVLPSAPDVVLLDNMTPDGVREAVALVDRLCAGGARPQLEASGGITLANVRDFAVAGADRISIGALTHSATALDLALEIEIRDTPRAARTGEGQQT